MFLLPDLLAELVRRPSVNPMGRTDLPDHITLEGRVTDYLEEQLRSLGCPYRRSIVAPGRANLVATYTPPTAAPFTLLLEAHQDTVPVDGMTIDPFAAVIEGGRLYGRGACDVKAGIAVMLTAFARLLRERPLNSAAVILAFTVDEECSFGGVRALVQEGVRADFAVVAEPTGLDIVHAHKGVMGWHVETPGIACHSSRPDQGVNAVYRMGRLLAGVEAYAARLHSSAPDPHLGPPTLSVGRIVGGVSPNTVPAFCRIEIDRRLIPGEQPESARAELHDHLLTHPGIDFPFRSSEVVFASPPLSPSKSSELVTRLGRVIDSVVGRHEVRAVPYATDAATLSEAGIPTVVFGPGDIAQAHTPDEWIDLTHLEPAAEILYRLACGR